ncbi:hypothetical protein XENOCAPTIV_015281, partial [Xenoophorus captivus]
PKPYLYKNDHTYPGVNKTDVPVVILYAEIGTKKFNSFHKVLSEKAEEGALVYVLRHFVAVRYGVELAIKSTEYKAVDDTEVKGELVAYRTVCTISCRVYANLGPACHFVDSKTVINAAEDNNDEVQGFFFGTLK